MLSCLHDRDNLVQVRAEKLFALISTMLFQRLCGIGSVARAELAQRVEGFGCRCYVMRAILAGTQRAATVEEEEVKRGTAAPSENPDGPSAQRRTTHNLLQDTRRGASSPNV